MTCSPELGSLREMDTASILFSTIIYWLQHDIGKAALDPFLIYQREHFASSLHVLLIMTAILSVYDAWLDHGKLDLGSMLDNRW